MIIKTSKVYLYYEKIGEGRPLILLHGNGENHTIYEKAIEILKYHYTVYAVDSRNHGGSSHVKGDLHYTEMADDIYEFIEKIHIKSPILYGFSDGGIIALILAIKYPDLLSKIIVSGVNTNPEGIRLSYLRLYKLIYFFTRSKTYKLMITEPNITDEILKTIKVPTFITAGSKDIIRISHIKKIASNIEGAEFTLFNGETHDSYVINSEKIAEFICETDR